MLLARQLLKLGNLPFSKNVAFSIRYVKPATAQVITENLSRQAINLQQAFNFLQNSTIRNCPSYSYEEVCPGFFRTYPALEQRFSEWNYEVRSKRHRVAKLKRQKRKDGKRTHLSNN